MEEKAALEHPSVSMLGWEIERAYLGGLKGLTMRRRRHGHGCRLSLLEFGCLCTGEMRSQWGPFCQHLSAFVIQEHVDMYEGNIPKTDLA